jgi:hypothetical protein
MTPEETWKHIHGYNHYEISNFGRIRKISYLRTWVCTKVGYEQLQVFETDGCGKKRIGSKDKGKVKKVLLHRLLAEAFIPNPDNLPCVNHKDGNKLNNSLDNLEWCSYSDNLKHAYAKGLRGKKKENKQKEVNNE